MSYLSWHEPTCSTESQVQSAPARGPVRAKGAETRTCVVYCLIASGLARIQKFAETGCELFAPRASLLNVMTACGVVDHRSGGRERRLDRPF
jgi:hypothetical protein